MEQALVLPTLAVEGCQTPPGTICIYPYSTVESASPALPEFHSPSQAPEDLSDISVVPTRLGDGDAQLCIAERAQSGHAPTQDPDEEGQTHGARVFQDTFG